MPECLEPDARYRRPEKNGNGRHTERATIVAVLSFRLYMAQRLSAMIMAPLVLLHLGAMIYAVQNGLDSAEILNRTRGSLFWGFSYGLFVLVVAVHAALGLRVIAYEWFGRSGTQLNVITTAVAMVLLAMGWRAVYAVVIA